MSEVEVVNLAVSAAEVRSISEIATLIADEILKFAEKYGVADQYNRDRLEEDVALFLVKRKVVGLEELRISILEDGASIGDSLTGKRIADLIFRIRYKEGGYMR
jgi:hypothetical protein